MNRLLSKTLRPLYYVFAIIALSLSLLACHQRVVVTGYVNGNFVYINTPVSGKLVEVLSVHRQLIQKGERLFKIALTPGMIKVDVIQQNIARLRKILADEKAVQNPSPERLAYQSDLARQLAQQRLLLKAIKSHLKTYAWHAERAGFLFNVFHDKNTYVSAGMPILSFLPLKHRFVVFYLNALQRQALRRAHNQVMIHWNNKRYSARVVYADGNAVDTCQQRGKHFDHRAYQYHAVPTTEARSLYPGQTVQVEIGG